MKKTIWCDSHGKKVNSISLYSPSVQLRHTKGSRKIENRNGWEDETELLRVKADDRLYEHQHMPSGPDVLLTLWGSIEYRQIYITVGRKITSISLSSRSRKPARESFCGHGLPWEGTFNSPSWCRVLWGRICQNIDEYSWAAPFVV